HLVARLRDEAASASETAQRESARAVRMSWIILATAGLCALALTVLIFRSIAMPLRRIGEAIGALTSGQTDIDVPEAGEHEIGAIARTLALFQRGADRAQPPGRRARAGNDPAAGGARPGDGGKPHTAGDLRPHG